MHSFEALTCGVREVIRIPSFVERSTVREDALFQILFVQNSVSAGGQWTPEHLWFARLVIVTFEAAARFPAGRLSQACMHVFSFFLREACGVFS